MKKRTAFLTVAVIAITSLILLGKDEKGSEANSEKSILVRIYEESKMKKVKKEIARKVYSKNFNELVDVLPLPKLEAINYLVGRDTLRESLNSKHPVADLQMINNPDIDLNDAENILKVSRELVDLSNISPELKNYLVKEYRGFDYLSFANKGDKILSYLRNKELIKNQLPQNMVELIEQLPPAKAESIIEILNGETIPQKIEFNTIDFIQMKMTYENMQKLYSLCQKIYKIGEIEPKFLTEANKLYLNLDYTRIARYGDFYLQDKFSLEKLEKDSKEREYSFEFPMITQNPFGRVLDMAYLTYPGVEDESLKIVIGGESGEEEFSYMQNHERFIKIYGLYLNGKPTEITLDNGEKKSQLTITGGEIPDEMPAIIVKNSSGSEKNELYYMTYTYEKKVYGIAIDKFGKIRYIFDPLGKRTAEEDRGEWGLLYKNDGFILFNEDIVFSFKMSGEIENSWSRFKYENEIGKLELKKLGTYNATTELMDDNSKSFTTIQFQNNNYPMGQLIETDLKDRRKIFEADIYFDKNSIKENKISDGRVIRFSN